MYKRKSFEKAILKEHSGQAIFFFLIFSYWEKVKCDTITMGKTLSSPLPWWSGVDLSEPLSVLSLRPSQEKEARTPRSQRAYSRDWKD